MTPRCRLAIDSGGTFTDFVLLDELDAARVFKVSSNAERPDETIAEGLELIATARGESVESFLAACEVIVLGTTIVTNALLQRAGARTGLLCTAGFRDSFEVRLGYKEERYDFDYAPPTMLVPRYLRLPVRERVLKTGEVAMALDEEDVLRHLETFRREGVEAVAVSFLWSFLEPAHERRVGEILRSEFPEAYHSLSVDLVPRIREYDRTSTTILNAYVGPVLKRYVERIEAMLDARGYRNQIRYTQANAGFTSGRSLMARPIAALNSGPAAGPTAGLFFARRLGETSIITADMGGTSFDVCLVEDGEPNRVTSADFDRYRVALPMIDINAIGAGGGSIAWIDAGGILRVGPRSAEAIPGPACYGRGGTEPTVTDANVVLGYFSPRALLGGKLHIDRGAAERAIETHIAGPLGMSVDEAAHGIFEVVNHSMTDGIAEVSIERGHDPRDFVLVVGGGTGPVHAGRLAAELELPTVLVPKVASAFCAFGAAVGDLVHDYTASYTGRLRALDLERLETLLDGMEARGRADLAEEGADPAAVTVTRSLDLRYVGQIHECSVSIPATRLSETSRLEIEGLFHDRHEALYAYAERDDGVCELINVGVTVRAKVADVHLPPLEEGPEDPSAALREERPVYFAEHGGFVTTAVYDGTQVSGGNVFVGPAIVEEPTTTIVVFPGCRMEMDSRGFYVISVGRALGGFDAQLTTVVAVANRPSET